MASKNSTYELALKIAGKVDSSLKKACNTADKNLSELGASAKKSAKVAAAALAAVGAGAIAAGTALFKIGESFDGAYDAIRIGTGATGKALGELEDSFKAVYKAVPASMDDAAAAIADYNTRLGVTGSTLEGLSKQALQVSDMLGDDLSGVVENSSKAFQQWNIAQENMAGEMDYIFKVSQSTGTGFTDLMTNMQTYGAQLQEMGYGFDESAALIGQLGKQGVNVTEVLGAMKKSVAAMAKEGIPATEGMQKYYTAIKNAGTATEATQIASNVFGARAGSTMAAAIRNGSLAVDSLTESLTTNGETIAGAAADTYDFAEKWAVFKQKMAVAVEPAATAAFSTLGEVFDRLSPQIEAMSPKIADLAGKAAAGIGNAVDMAIKAAEWIGKNSTLVLTLAGSIGAAIVAYKTIKGVMAVYNTISAIHKVLTMASVGATVAQTAATAGAIAPTTALAAAMTAVDWPILIIVAAIAALIAIVVLLVKNWDKVKAVAIVVWEAIKGAWNAAAKWFNDNVITPLVNFFTPIVQVVSGIFRGCWIIIQAIWKAVSTWFYNTVITPLVGFFAPIVQTIGGFFSALWDGIVSVWSAVGSWFSEHVAEPIKAAFQVVSDFVKGIFNTLLGFVEGMINNVIGLINKFIGGFSGIVSSAAAFIGVDWDGIPEFPTVTLPRLAAGGIATSPTLAEIGEGAEPEAVLPLSKLAAMLDKQGKKPKIGGETGGDNDTITFAPVFQFYGSTTKEEAEEAGRISFAEFKRLYKQMKAEKLRKEFSPA